MHTDIPYTESELDANTPSTHIEGLVITFKNAYYGIVDPIRQPAKVEDEHRRFVHRYFESPSDYRSLVDELRSPPQSEYIQTAVDNQLEYRSIPRPRHTYMAALYAYLRQYPPEVVVETGVRDGWSTLFMLLALKENENGLLHSIDYPVFADDSNADESAFPTIPVDKRPGWIIPVDLIDRWELIIGRSQRELPALVLENDSIDVFLHDSEHSIPCLLFELELVWEFLSPGGIAFADDIRRMETAFDAFIKERRCEYGRLRSTGDFGYIRKPDEAL